MTIKNYIINSIIILALSCPSTPSEPENPSLNILWQTSTELVDIPNSELLLIENEVLVYSGEAELLTAISTEDGSLIWQSNLYDGRALRADHLLYSKENNRIIGRHFNNVMAWNATNGDKVFELSDSLNGISTSRVNYNTLTDNGFALVGEYNDAHIMDWDGELRYSIRIPWSTFSVDYFESKLFIGQRNTVNGGLTQGRIRAFDAITGDSLWTYQTDNGGFHTRLFVQDGIVYGAAKGNSPLGEIVALDSKTGQKQWAYNEKDRAQTQNLAISNNKIYANTGGGITALNLENGELAWRVDWMGFDSNKPVYIQGYVYHVRDFELLVIDDDNGEVLHREPVPKGNGYFWNVTAGSDKIFVQTNTQLIAYQPWHLRD